MIVRSAEKYLLFSTKHAIKTFKCNQLFIFAVFVYISLHTKQMLKSFSLVKKQNKISETQTVHKFCNDLVNSKDSIRSRRLIFCSFLVDYYYFDLKQNHKIKPKNWAKSSIHGL